MTTGCAARVAYNPQALVAFIDYHTQYVVTGSPRRRRRVVHGQPVSQAIDARTIRRWRSGAFDSVTQRSVSRVLTNFELSTHDFIDWATSHGVVPYIRGAP